MLLPFAITIAVVLFVIHFLTDPFQESVYTFLYSYENLQQPFLFFTAEQTLYFASTLLILLCLFGIVLLIGFLGHLVYGRTLFHLGDRLMRRIPVISKVYQAIQEAVNSFLHSKESLFSQVVLVPFPTNGAKTIGLTSHPPSTEGIQGPLKETAVFIPSALNPTYGVVLFYKPDKLTPLEMTVEEAFKMIVSCGASYPASGESI